MKAARLLGVVLVAGLLLALTALTLSTPPTRAQGTTYYVDNGHPSASDSNPGTESEPWLTIQHAADVATAGDTVVVKAGSYWERVVPQNSGTVGHRITFRAEPRRSVTMYGYYTVNASYLRIEGFNITPKPPPRGWTENDGVFIRSDHVEVVDNYFHDIENVAIRGYWHAPYPRAATIARNTVYHAQMGMSVHGYDWVVEDNEIERLYDYGNGDCDYMRFFGDDHVIRGNHLHGTQFSEIGSAHVDCFQTFDNNGEFVHDVVIEGNTCTDFHQGFMGEGHYYHDVTRITFRNNVFAHGGAWGLCVQDISYLTAVNNTFVDIQHHGIGVSGSYGHHATIVSNIFYDTGTSYWFPSGSGSTGDHNLVYGSSSPPVSGVHDLLGVDPLFVDAAAGNYGLTPSSPAVDAGAWRTEVDGDLDGTPRPQGVGWDIGAFEYLPNLSLRGYPGDRTIHLDWSVSVSLPATGTWRIDYRTQAPGSELSASLPLSTTRAHTLTGLINHEWYSVTLHALLGSTSTLSDTVRTWPAGRFSYLPIANRGR